MLRTAVQEGSLDKVDILFGLRGLVNLSRDIFVQLEQRSSR